MCAKRCYAITKGKGKKEIDGAQMWRYCNDQLNLNKVLIFAYRFPGVSNVPQLPSRTFSFVR